MHVQMMMLVRVGAKLRRFASDAAAREALAALGSTYEGMLGSQVRGFCRSRDEPLLGANPCHA